MEVSRQSHDPVVLNPEKSRGTQCIAGGPQGRSERVRRRDRNPDRTASRYTDSSYRLVAHKIECLLGRGTA
jgi:hypothetical protein